MPRPAAVARVALAAVVAAVLPACFAGHESRAPAAAATGPRGVYVAIGASETVGVGSAVPLRDAWPQVFFRTALPRDTEFVNFGVDGATVADALTDEVPDALELKPTVATVWLNVNDIRALVTPSTYERRLRELVRELRRGGATRVLVANTPPLDDLPALPSFVPGLVADAVVDRYNQAIARVVDDEGAVLVDLHALGKAAEEDGTFPRLIAADGFHPSTAGHAAVAKAFAAAWRRVAKVR